MTFPRISQPHNFVNSSDCYLKLRVQDTGHGIEKENLNRIFHPYFTTKEKGKGTGLGLSVVDGIVKQTQGMIKFNSAIGKGSWFEIYWPVHQPHSTFAAFGQTEAVGYCNGNERIMFVDDEDDILETSRALLNHMGYMVEPFRDGWAALQHFTDNPDGFDLVITDLSMPKLSGDQLAARILKINRGIPIILCTGYSEKFDMQQAYQIDIRKYLVKPVTCQQLSSSIRKVIGADVNLRQMQIV